MKNSKPAFPVTGTQYLENVPGMTMRQYYKAAALTGLLANPDSMGSVKELAKFAGTYADAMLAEDEQNG